MVTFEKREGREATFTTVNFQPRPRSQAVLKKHLSATASSALVRVISSAVRPHGCSGRGEWVWVYALRPPDPESGQQGDKPSGG